MFDHVTLRASDRAASERFYDAVLGAIGIERTATNAEFTEWDDFSIAQATDERPVTRGAHIGFVAPSREHVDGFWRTGTEAGHRDDGAPGPRPQYRGDYYGGFLLDPDGNSAEALHHESLRRGGSVDHVWVRVPDAAAARAFYVTVAPYGAFRLAGEREGRHTFAGTSGSFTVLEGRPTENLHMAFPAGDNETVDAFHHAATTAGYRDNGAPGERPGYHPGYYGAFVLDPAGNNIEVVHHNRPA